MATQFDWTFDAPDGVYKNHMLSSNLRIAAIANMKFMTFVTPEGGPGKKTGESITITRLADLAEPTDGRITEGQRIPEDEISISTIQITVTEWGRSVPYTSLSEQLGRFDPRSMIQRKLRDQLGLTLDTAAAAAFKTAQVKAIPTGAATIVFDTDGTASFTATSNQKFFHVESIRDFLFNDLRVPPLDGGDYVAIATTKHLRGIKSDSKFEEWHKYVSGPEGNQIKFNGEVGRLEGIRFIETNHSQALNNAVGSGGVLGEAVYFGEDSVAMATSVDPELRAEQPDDFGRKKSVAWYGILEFGIIWDTANAGEAKIIHVTSQ